MTKADFAAWRSRWRSCFWCGWQIGTRWPHSGWLPKLEANHIFGGAKKDRTRYALWSLVMLCQWCHQERWPRTRNRQRIVVGAALKLQHDPQHFDLDELNAMHNGEPITLAELRQELDYMENVK